MQDFLSDDIAVQIERREGGFRFVLFQREFVWNRGSYSEPWIVMGICDLSEHTKSYDDLIDMGTIHLLDFQGAEFIPNCFVKLTSDGLKFAYPSQGMSAVGAAVQELMRQERQNS